MADDACPILKARNDKREYRRVKLPNELEVLLVSDKETDKAAAAMSVNVGYFNDPEDMPGLAHFLEHMLFYSSEKYPEEDSYSKFLTEHGGHANAYTSAEQTNYHLDVSHEYLEEALDRFAQFFICPLLSADATAREMKAVDSENSKNLNSDGWRLRMLLKSVSSDSHPYHKFGTGNLQTLDEAPRSQGKDTRDELLAFYRTWYSANIMRLVVYGRHPLDELESMVAAKFGPVANEHKAPLAVPGQPCDREHLQLLIRAVPVTEGHSVEFSWPMPSERRVYRTAPSRYLSHLLGHEGKGSVFALLKSKGWATGLSAGETESSWEFAFFSISVELTEEGHAHFEEVASLVFQYLTILRSEGGVVPWIFDEVRDMCEIKFHHQDVRPPFSYVSGLAANMQVYPAEDWLAASSLPREFDPATIRAVLDHLTPSNVRILWVSKSFEGVATRAEQWYGTKFSTEPLDSGLVQAWAAPAVAGDLHLPPPNEFLPSDFSLKDSSGASKHPVLLRQTPVSRLWHKPDAAFLTPKAYVILDFSCPAAYTSPEAAALTRLYTMLLQDYLNEHAYAAEISGLSYSIEPTTLGFQVSVAGYNHKLTLLANKILSRLVAFEVLPDRFGVVKEKLLKHFLNRQYDAPYQQALYDLSVVLDHRRWHLDEYKDVLPGLSPEDLAAFFPHLLSRVHIESYIAGNMAAAEAEQFLAHVEEVLAHGPGLKVRPLFASQHAEKRVVQLPPGAAFYHPLPGLNPDEDNSALLFYLQVGQDEPHINALLELLVQTAKRDAFHQLRSVEQLGYIVFLLPRNDHGVRGIQGIIQSNVKDATGLEERMEAFWEGFEQTLGALSEEEFQTHVEALVAIKTEKFKSLGEETGFYWRELEDGTLMFDRVEAEVAELRSIELEELRAFFAERVKAGASGRRKLSARIFGGGHQAAYREALQGPTMAAHAAGRLSPVVSIRENGVTVANGVEEKLGAPAGTVCIDDVYTFKNSMPLFSSFKGRLQGLHKL